jgi:hypothetical protein
MTALRLRWLALILLLVVPLLVARMVPLRAILLLVVR